MERRWKVYFLGLGLWWGCQSQPTQSVAPTKAKDTLPIQAVSQPRLTWNLYWTDLARLLGGLWPQDTLFWRNAIRDTAWLGYRRRLEWLWAQRQKALYDSLGPWAARALDTLYYWQGLVFYPFSGADWPTIAYIYPHGERYLFFGLEQEGDPHYVRLLEPAEIARNLQGPYAAMADLLRLSFFKTKEMQQFLVRGKLKGLLPVFLAFFARTGYGVYTVEPIYLDAMGRIDTLAAGRRKPAQSPWDTLVTGLRFVIGKPQEKPKEVIYLSFNAANAGLTQQKGLLTYLKRQRPCVTFIKSASYLLFGRDFSQIRRLILENSVAILQEDSGIPYRYFDSTSWHIRLYGVYHAPIPLFRNKMQRDLWEAYRTHPVKPLPFGIGYHITAGQSNLLLAVRQNPQLPLSIPAEASAQVSPDPAPMQPLPADTSASIVKDSLAPPPSKDSLLPDSSLDSE